MKYRLRKSIDQQFELEYEIEGGTQDLMEHFEMQFDKHRFSNKFRNVTIENSYLDHFYNDFAALSLITLWESVAIILAIATYTIFFLIQT